MFYFPINAFMTWSGTMVGLGIKRGELKDLWNTTLEEISQSNRSLGRA